MCSPGFEGDACEKDIPCDCNGKGTCKAGRCHCMPGYEGESCEIKAKCPQDCSGHVFAAGRPAIASLAMLAKHVRKTQRRCGNKAVYPLAAQPTVTAMASAGMAWEITTVTL